MVNENKGKVYSPIPFYNRKYVRYILRQVAEEHGGNASRNMAQMFKYGYMKKPRPGEKKNG